MSYCVECGVKLADYHKKCPLCGTPVVNPNRKVKVNNTHYPNYEVVEPSEKKMVNRYVTGIILSVQAVAYSIIVLLIDWLTDAKIYWSLIPILSLSLLWFCIAYPFFRKRNTFFRLFTYDSIAVCMYLFALNLVISQNASWAKFACVGILLLWVIIAGIFITERIRKALPITFFYILSAVVITLIMLSFFRHEANIFEIGIPIAAAFLVLGLLSYFLIKSSKNGIIGMLSVLLTDISIFAVVIDLITRYYAIGKVSVSWSVIVVLITVPSIVTMLGINKTAELRAYITRKMHR